MRDYKYYYVYKITCTSGSLKDSYYIGQHKTNNINDGYKGSGTLIRNYFKKFPNDYIKEILCFCNNVDELNEMEKFYIGNLYKTDDLCINLVAGGTYGEISDEGKRRIGETSSIRMKNDNPMKNPDIAKKVADKNRGKCYISDDGKRRIGEYSSIRMKKDNPMKNPDIAKKVANTKKGMKLSEETKQKISERLKGISRSDEYKKKMSLSKQGEKNGAFGRRWMNNGVEQKFVKFDDISLFLDNGYVFGVIKK